MKRRTKQSKKVKMAARWRKGGNGYELVPWLTLSGKWLGENGFEIGEILKVTCRERLLVIEVAEDEEALDYIKSKRIRNMEKILQELSK
jgi:hypothetical protein